MFKMTVLITIKPLIKMANVENILFGRNESDFNVLPPSRTKQAITKVKSWTFCQFYAKMLTFWMPYLFDSSLFVLNI